MLGELGRRLDFSPLLAEPARTYHTSRPRRAARRGRFTPGSRRASRPVIACVELSPA